MQPALLSNCLRIPSKFLLSEDIIYDRYSILKMVYDWLGAFSRTMPD